MHHRDLEFSAFRLSLTEAFWHGAGTKTASCLGPSSNRNLQPTPLTRLVLRAAESVDRLEICNNKQ